jgi:membrane protein implicated in regulation of membrane protease activity
MNMAPYIYWFLAGLVLLGLEMVSGTFYLLVLAVALGIGGLAALAGLELPLQFTLAALAGIAGTAILRRKRKDGTVAANDQNLDIGQPVQVVAWRENGTARVHYRGAEWDAQAESAATPREATLYIKALHGATLVLTHHKPSQGE